MVDGARSTHLPLRSFVDEFLCNTDSGTGKEACRVPKDAVRAQLAIGSGIAFATWASLQATNGTSAGQRAEVFGDAGTHTDPVVGGTVSNAGVYGWSTSPVGWRRLGTLDIAGVQSQIDALSVSQDSIKRVAICRVDGIYRPGDAPGIFSADHAGFAEDMTPLAAAGVVASSSGRSFRITGSGKVILRPAIWLLDSRSWKCRTIYRRITDPSDPLGDAVRTVVYWLDSAFALITSQNIITDSGALVANGSRSNSFGLPAPPPNAVFARIGVQTFGADGVTNIQEVAINDVTEVNALVGESTYDGVWDASANTPTLASGVGVKGHYRIVSVAGPTNINGISSWAVGDWIIFNGTAWEKIPNSATLTTSMLSALLDTLPTDPVPLASGVWWNNSGLFNRTPIFGGRLLDMSDPANSQYQLIGWI